MSHRAGRIVAVTLLSVAPWTGSVAHAAELAGVENVLVLQGGLNQWKAEGGFDAQRRATQPAK